LSYRRVMNRIFPPEADPPVAGVFQFPTRLHPDRASRIGKHCGQVLDL